MFLIGLTLAAGVALQAIRDAERTANDQRSVAERSADRARSAERALRDQLLVVQQKEMARVTQEQRRLTGDRARNREGGGAEAQTAVAAGREQLALSNETAPRRPHRRPRGHRSVRSAPPVREEGPSATMRPA